MTNEEKMGVRSMLVLTLPTLGFAMGLSLVTTYLPVILKNYTDSATLIGFAIGGEGIFSAAIPLFVGVVSDRIWTKRWGRRQTFHDLRGALHGRRAHAGALPDRIRAHRGVDVRLLCRLPFLHVALSVAPPRRHPSVSHGRVQGVQSFMRGGGMFLGMVVAGVMFARWIPSPFILCSILIMVFTY